MKKQALTLMELILAIVFLAVVMLIIGAVAYSLFQTKSSVQKDAANIQANLANETVVQRVLRAVSKNIDTAAFTVTNGGTDLTYKTLQGTQERVWLERGSLMYQQGAKVTTLLSNIKTVKFSQGFGNRLDMEIEMNDGQRVSTAVMPRNAVTPEQIIN